MIVDFGKTSEDYSRYRIGFPPAFFDRLAGFGIGKPGQSVLDLGTGTGTLARGLALRGCRVVGMDIAAAQMEHARRLDQAAGVTVELWWTYLGGVGIHPEWVRDVAEAGFRDIETFSLDVDLSYSHEAWRGRVRASAPIAATLTPDQVIRFDAEFQSLLAQDFPTEPMLIPHRVFAIVCITPGLHEPLQG